MGVGGEGVGVGVNISLVREVMVNLLTTMTKVFAMTKFMLNNNHSNVADNYG